MRANFVAFCRSSLDVVEFRSLFRWGLAIGALDRMTELVELRRWTGPPLLLSLIVLVARVRR